MENKKVYLRIVTPQGVKVEQKVDMVIMRCLDGDMGILPNHEAVSTVLGNGKLRIIDEEKEQSMDISGGIVVVKNNTVNLLTGLARA